MRARGSLGAYNVADAVAGAMGTFPASADSVANAVGICFASADAMPTGSDQDELAIGVGGGDAGEAEGGFSASSS